MNKLIPVCLGLALLLFTTAVRAGTITMQVSTTCSVADDGVTVQVTATNTGDEAATNVRINAVMGELTASSPSMARLEPGSDFPVRLFFQPRLTVPGAYPVAVTVDFQDVNGYVFSAVSSGVFIHMSQAESLVTAERKTAVLGRDNKLSLTIENRDSSANEVSIRLISPREIEVEPPVKSVRAEAGGKAETVFTLRNRSARDGAAYPVLAFLEYERGGIHFTFVTENLVTVGRAENFFKRNRFIFAAAGLLLLLAAIFCQAAGRRSAKGRG